jgi:PAS domain S-box-containing protein
MPVPSSNSPISPLDFDQQRNILISIAERRRAAAVVEKAIGGRILCWNDAATKLYGYDAEEVVGRSGLVLHDPAEVESGRAAAIFERALITGKWEGRTYRVRRDGSGFWAHLTLLLRRDAQGRAQSLVAICRDLTEIERIERDVMRSRALGCGLVESMSEPLVATDAAGRILEVNTLFCDLIGQDRQSLLGTCLCALFESPPDIEALLAGAKRHDEMSQSDLGLLGDATQKLRVQATAFVAPRMDCRADAFLVVLQGPPQFAATRAKTPSCVENVLYPRKPSTAPPASQSFSSAPASPSSMSSEAAELSHELRTPLTAVIGFAELMRSGQAGPMGLVQREYMDDILHSAQHMLRVLNAALESAREVHTNAPRGPVELSAVLTSAHSALRLAAAKKRIDVLLEQSCELSLAAESATRVQQIVFNYLSNAVKFTPEAGRVTLACQVIDGTTLCVEVRDTGSGIRPDQQSRLFRDFDQLDIDEGLREQGTGIGLAITRRLARSLGGDVTLSSTQGEGSVFGVRLPLARLGRSGDMDGDRTLCA